MPGGSVCHTIIILDLVWASELTAMGLLYLIDGTDSHGHFHFVTIVLLPVYELPNHWAKQEKSLSEHGDQLELFG